MEKKIDKSIFIKILIIIIVVIGLFLVIKIESFTKMLNNVHNISGIGSKIDSVQIGDKINYSANGVEDWEVLSVDKGNNTIEIVSAESVQNLTLKGYQGWLTAKSKMQKIADKYVEGPYAISARNLNKNDIDSAADKITNTGCFWLEDQMIGKSDSDEISSYANYYMCVGYTSNSGYEFSNGTTTLASTGLYGDYGVRIVVTLNDSNARNYNVGSPYKYFSNGIEYWRVLSINSDSSISIITGNVQPVDLVTDDNIVHITDYFNKILSDYYDNDNVTSVRFTNEDDKSNLIKLGITENLFTGKTGDTSMDTYTSNYNGKIYTSVNYRYGYQYLNYCYWCNEKKYNTSSSSVYISSIEYGVRPVVTLRYSEKLHEGKQIDTNLQAGDQVSYKANDYSSWKVLNIDKTNGTAEIVSSGIVKLLTLKGMDNYNNLSNILQKEVDNYLNGDNAISARILNSSDIMSLTSIKDNCNQVYWLNDKKEYNYKWNGIADCASTYYAAAVAVYDDTSSNVIRKWATLNAKYNKDVIQANCGSSAGSFEYTAGIRPVIKVKLATLSKTKNTPTSEEIKVPENKQEAITDSVIEEQNNPSLGGKENEWIVYESKEEKNNSNNSANKVNRAQYIPVIIISVIAASFVSGLIVYYIVRKKYGNTLNDNSNKKNNRKNKKEKADDII